MGEPMDMLSWYRVGQLVICIDDAPVSTPTYPRLMLRCVYDIASVCRSERRPNVVCFRLLQHGPFLYPAYLFKPVKPKSIEGLLQQNLATDNRPDCHTNTKSPVWG